MTDNNNNNNKMTCEINMPFSDTMLMHMSFAVSFVDAVCSAKPDLLFCFINEPSDIKTFQSQQNSCPPPSFGLLFGHANTNIYGFTHM